MTAAGDIRFSPRPTFSGDSKALYTASSSNGSTVTGTLRATVLPLTPTAHDEKVATRYERAARFAAASDDTAGGPSAPLVPATTVLVAPVVDPGGKTYTTRAGTWSVQADGSVRVVPATGYSGTSAVTYRTADRNGTRVSATLTLTVRSGPRSVPLTASTAVGRPVRLTPLAKDTPGQRTDGTTATFDPATMALLTTGLPTDSAVTNSGRTLTVPGQGVWTVDAAVDSVTFDPARSFSGPAATVTYQVRDGGGSTVTGRLTVAVVGSAPVATDDVASTPATAAVVLPGATNDSAGAAPLSPGLTVFPADGQPAGSTRATDGKTLTVPGQGTWTLGSDGAATFAPDPAFAGTTATVAYRISDSTGATARANLRVVVQARPTARPDAVRIGFRSGDGVTVPVLDNDVPGRNADGSLGATDRTTLRFPVTGQADGWSIEQDGTLANLGPLGQEVFAYVDHANGTISVNRVSVRTPMTLALRYTVSDVVRTGDGAVVHRATTGTLQIEVPVTAPIAVDDVASTPSPLPVELPALANDVPGDLSVPIRTTVSSLTFPTDQELPPGSVINNNPYPSATVTVPGQGVWSRLAHSQEVYFTPDPAFVGDASVRYLVSDNEGWTAEGTLRVTVLQGASAHDDAGTTAQGVPATVDLLANDDAGLNTDRTQAVWDTGAFYFPPGGQPSGSTSNFRQRQLVVPGQGRYTLQRSGAVVFEPAASFTGTTTPVTVALQALVQADRPQERYFSTTLTVTVSPATPTATDDRATTEPGHPVVVRVLDNDRAGLPAVPLDTSSVRLRRPADAPAGSTLYGDATTLVLPGQGTFLVAGDGEVTFVPLGSGTGSDTGTGTLTVGYQVADANGTTTRANLTVTVG